MQRYSLSILIGIAALCLGGITLAYTASSSQLQSLTRAAVLIGAAMALNLLVGNAGLISIGQGMFVGIGAYVVAVATIRYDVPLSTSIVLAILGAAVIAGLAGAIALRAKALFFALLTLALSEVAFVCVSLNYSLTGGDDGLAGVPVPRSLISPQSQHILAVLVTTAITLAVLTVLASPFGATLRAIRDNRDRVASLGANPKFYELTAFILAGALGAVAGTMIAVTDRAVTPNLISWTTGTLLLVMVAVGGRFTFFGPVIGVILLEVTRAEVQSRSFHADLVIGILIIACAIAFPEGIASRARQAVEWLTSRREHRHAR